MSFKVELEAQLLEACTHDIHAHVWVGKCAC